MGKRGNGKQEREMSVVGSIRFLKFTAMKGVAKQFGKRIDLRRALGVEG
jgi:hypothetical protein